MAVRETFVRRRGARFAAGAGVLAVALLLTACAGAAPSAGPAAGEQTAPGDAAASDAPQAAGSGRDLSEGGSCVGGEDIVIAADGSSAVVDGPCGTVTITGADFGGNIESAESVEVSGANASVLGTEWGEARVLADGVTLNVDSLQRLVTEAAGTHLTTQRAGELVIDGDGATVNGGEAERVALNASDATVVLTAITGALEVHGDRNIVNWATGVEAPTADTGAENVYTH
ncbi:hypothetical protein GCM10010196_23570 [Agromyces mediolanus]|uniref:DUF3060 domain-containing protein n=2 Tax=Agromyces mediolanus TaxID=41986 RepID=A0A918FED2_AGRME|nr:hypothetical protein GCM10010196_23570 [Agromyces mediolanus]GLJ72153.1 hypothetical protein GCM10017583_14090 [Agromyces mediolanus]